MAVIWALRNGCSTAAAMVVCSLSATGQAAAQQPGSGSQGSEGSLAQNTDRSGADGEEIIVTAQKRSSALQDVPFSISATTEAQIRNTGSNSIVDLARNVAGLAIADLGPGQSNVAIRGVSSGQVVRDESSRKETVGVYLDESVISLALFTPDLDLFDLSRVEVLRGPQGDLFGSGSLGGTLRYITNQPELHTLEGAVEAQVGVIENGSAFWSAKGAVNVPVLRDKLAVRMVGYYNRYGGFIDAITPSGGIQEDVNDGKRYGGRLAATFAPIEAVTITPRVVYQRLETNGYPRADIFNIFRNRLTSTRVPGTFGPLQQYRQSPEGITDDFLLADLKFEADLGPVTLTAVSSYTDRQVDVRRDSAQLTGQINEVAIGIPGSATLDAPLLDRTQVEVFTQEVRLASRGSGPLQYVLGAYYIDQQKRFGQRLETPGFTTLFNRITGSALDSRASAPVTQDPDVLFVSAFDIGFRQYALFGQASYDVTDRLTATAGLRYYDFKESREAVIAGFFNCGDSLTDCATPEPLRQRTIKSSGFNPRAILAYEVSDDVTLNAQVARGFRLGGINDPLITNICRDDIGALGGRDIEKFGDEHVWNYEAGVKSQFADRRITLNAAAYYVDIRDLQVSARLRCSSTIIVNVPRARTIGFEAELSARPTNELTLGISLSFNDSRVRSDVDIPEAVSGENLIQRGDRLPTSPRYQASTNATYTRRISERLSTFVSGVVQHQSSSYSFLSDQRNNNRLPVTVRFGRPVGQPVETSFKTILSPYAIGNLRFGLRSSESWEAAIFINNVWNQRAELALDRERGGEGRVAYLINQPRTIGVNLRTEFR